MDLVVFKVREFPIRRFIGYHILTKTSTKSHADFHETPHALKTRLKITQLEKAHFIKLNELKLTQVELF